MNFLSPIDKNRDEVIAIPFNGWIKNIGEMMVKSIMSTGKIYEWYNKYPFIKDLTMNLEAARLFNTTSFYTALSFLDAMHKSNKNIEKADLEKDYSEIMSYLNPKSAAVTQMEIIIIRLLEEGFLKKMYIYSPWISPEVRDYVSNTLITKNRDKVYLIEGRVRDIFRSYPDITTLFVDEVDDLMDLIQSYPDHDKEMYEKFFVISANPSVTTEAKRLILSGKDENEIPNKYRYEEYMKTLPSRFNSEATYMQLKMMTNRGDGSGQSK